jgi:hypothetical protein
LLNSCKNLPAYTPQGLDNQPTVAYTRFTEF